jgi:hypothetical protein
MDKFLKLGHIEIEIVSPLIDERRKCSWEKADSECKEKGLRLPTLKELKYIHNVLYLKSIGNIGEGSEYWAYESSTIPGLIGATRLESHKTYWMKWNPIESGAYDYSKMRYRGVRDI